MNQAGPARLLTLRVRRSHHLFYLLTFYPSPAASPRYAAGDGHVTGQTLSAVERTANVARPTKTAIQITSPIGSAIGTEEPRTTSVQIFMTW